MPEQILQPLEIPVLGMTCASCVGRVEKAISAVPGVARATVNLAAERAHVELTPEGHTQAVIEAIRKAGYQPLERTLTLKVEGMTCASCVGRVERSRGRRASFGRVNLATERASLTVLGAGPPPHPGRAESWLPRAPIARANAGLTDQTGGASEIGGEGGLVVARHRAALPGEITFWGPSSSRQQFWASA